ncbi:hypothetical protein PAXRUDRAFT_549372 [Paxillus rubicundulus Ve08.2h10]|uniref:Uncharacterized protein n=1 Tax=Paxillus rubicundulus Ve08.2h10 TaxID=930991 RepID=A0A0D0E5T1_9AGAM|nr:hypothetical protein PAXRUDRAFT_549372 [Paxillus rubicundulus Ve08.2h10]
MGHVTAAGINTRSTNRTYGAHNTTSVRRFTRCEPCNCVLVLAQLLLRTLCLLSFSHRRAPKRAESEASRQDNKT